MAEQSLNSVVARLQQLASQTGDDSVPDHELLQRYRSQRDSAALELLIWRHGTMVLATCRRVLGGSPDAEDAFQATFLILVRKAQSVRSQSLAAWLHRVAFNICLRLRKRRMLQLKSERAAARPDQTPATPEPVDWRPVLDEEISRLPQRFRSAFLLCHYEGKTRDEAARLLGVPRGTLRSRLARAREQLRNRLIRRGIAPAVCGAALSATIEPASAALVNSTLNLISSNPAVIPGAIAVLVEGVIRDMILVKIKRAAAIAVMSAAVLLGAGLAIVPGKSARLLADQNTPQVLPGTNKPADTRTPPPASNPKSGQRTDAAPATEGVAPLDLLVPAKPVTKIDAIEDDRQLFGTWKVEEVVANGQHRDPGDMHLMFGPFRTMMMQNTITAKLGEKLSYKVDPNSNPPSIEMTHDGKTQVGSYWLDGDNLKICMAEQGKRPPTRFESRSGSGNVSFVLNRKWGSAETKWAAKVFHKGLSHDFGKIQSMDTPPIYRFPIKNVYPQTIGIIGASFSSDWAKVKFPSPGSFTPGAESVLEVIIDPTKLSGNQSMTISVSFEVQESPARMNQGYTPGTAKGSIASTRVKPEKMVSYAELTIHAEAESK